jgi:hypothetical protein
VQIGDYGKQENTFFYTLRSPDAADLLHQDQNLARAVADYLCPQGHAQGNFTVLRGALEESLTKLPVEWDRLRLLQFPPPEPGETLRISRADAVTVGRALHVSSSEVVDFQIAPNTERSLDDVRKASRAASADIDPIEQTSQTEQMQESADVDDRSPGYFDLF